ncbi:MAG: hypothetical protein MUF01_13290 [Bryobacterales bacterium]|nr:hypothetical protein [Bryobacterales bacterium]
MEPARIHRPPSSRKGQCIAILLLTLLLFLSPASAWDGTGKATYVGGTIVGLPDSAKGNIGTTDEDFFVFDSNAVEVAIPWERINLLEYGQRVGRRIGLALAVSPLFLMTKSRKHFLTISFQDERDRQQALVFQLDKAHVRSVLVTMEARTGLRVELQDNEARFGGESQ